VSVDFALSSVAIVTLVVECHLGAVVEPADAVASLFDAAEFAFVYGVSPGIEIYG
jgi:hypothetical protein